MANPQGLIYKDIYPLSMAPGILRDGTLFSKPNWTDGQWVRFYRGLPRKIGGYRQISANNVYISRGLIVVPDGNNFNVYVGTSNTIGYATIDFFGNPIGSIVDRTPMPPTSPPFAVNSNNSWQFDVMYSGSGDASIIVAHAAPNLASIDNAIQRPIYYGDINGTGPLIPTGFSVSGGIMVLTPYLFMLDNNGYVIISNPDDPTTQLDSFRIAPYKLIAGLPVRGGNTSPAGLIWSLDRLIRVTQVGTTMGPEWNFDTVSAAISVMSAACMVEFDSQYYWMGIDRFYNYNGVVQELVNDLSWEYIFNNINYAAREKVWATKVTAWGEIWWFYPDGNNTECNRVAIYNVRERTWYDTAINRSCGYYASTFGQPIWADNVPNEDNFYPVWQHEEGFDENVNGTLKPINSSITTGILSWIGTDPNRQRRGMDRWMSLYRVEPNFVQSGDMQMLVIFQDYPQSTVTYTSGPYTFSPSDVKIDMDTPRQGRNVRIQFISNAVGGDYELGETLLVATVGDGRQSYPGS
jgi:hypothetical protein